MRARGSGRGRRTAERDGTHDVGAADPTAGVRTTSQFPPLGGVLGHLTGMPTTLPCGFAEPERSGARPKDPPTFATGFRNMAEASNAAALSQRLAGPSAPFCIRDLQRAKPFVYGLRADDARPFVRLFALICSERVIRIYPRLALDRVWRFSRSTLRAIWYCWENRGKHRRSSKHHRFGFIHIEVTARSRELHSGERRGLGTGRR